MDRFANHVNAKFPRFNSRFWIPGSEGIGVFVMNWHGENNYVCPPICLILRALYHMRNCKASGSLIVPLWHSAPFSPMICPDGECFASFISGKCNSVFGNENLNFRMIALSVHFDC